ncbi:arginine N-succinyltransferase, partial [Sphingomonas sp. CCH9-F2]
TMTARTDQVRTIRDARDATVDAVGDAPGATEALIATGRLAAFRCAYGRIAERDGAVTIDPACARALGVGAGDAISWIGRL